jgi:hypothetical protein
MKQKITVAVALVLLQLGAAAQLPKYKFKTINQLGLLHGASGNEVQWQTINGLAYRGFFAGAGVGVDNYYFKTIPVFIDLRKNIFNSRNTPFVYADLGAGFPVRKKVIVNPWEKTEYSPAVYYDLGLGFTTPVIGRLALNISMGYSQKNVSQKNVYSYFWDFPPYGQSSTFEYYDYTFRRLTLKLGLSF